MQENPHLVSEPLGGEEVESSLGWHLTSHPRRRTKPQKPLERFQKPTSKPEAP